VTYARRYGLSLALGLAPSDDDDGNTGNVVDIKPSNAPRAASGANGPVETVAGARRQLANGEEYDATTGELIDGEALEAMLWRADESLARASQRGSKVLEQQWLALPKGKGLQAKLKARLEEKYKPQA
jgi:hypothetical protein